MSETPPQPRSAPWLRQPDETSKAFAAFCVFRDLGEKRTVTDAYRQSTGRRSASQPPGHWRAWAKRHRWAERAAAFDRRLDAAGAAAAEAVAADQAEQLAIRRTTWSEAEYCMAVALAVAELKRVKSGDTRGAGQNMEAAARLARQALRMPVEVEAPQPMNLIGLLFETDGQLDAAMPPGSIPPMPENPEKLPPMNRTAAAGGSSLHKPTKIPRP